MTVEQSSAIRVTVRNGAFAWLRPVAPPLVFGLAVIAVFAAATYYHLSLETLLRHRAALDAFVGTYNLTALGAYILIYIASVALSIPSATFLTISGGVMFGTLLGGVAAIIGGTIGATIIFLVARSACGEGLARRAGPFAAKIADEFRADAFSYLLFLRLVPAFPFFLVNLAVALIGVPLRSFILATAIGIVPATFVFAFLGNGLDSMLAAQELAFRHCVAAGGPDCRLHFDLGMVVTPRLIAALAAVSAIALVPMAFKRLRTRSAERST